MLVSFICVIRADFCSLIKNLSNQKMVKPIPDTRIGLTNYFWSSRPLGSKPLLTIVVPGPQRPSIMPTLPHGEACLVWRLPLLKTKAPCWVGGFPFSNPNSRIEEHPVTMNQHVLCIVEHG